MLEEESARSVAFQDPLIGRVLQDRYRVLRLLGRGGMGVVYLAEHVLIRRKLALKVLHSQLTASEELVQRFHREARAAATVGNEHIVEVTDMGRLDDGTYFIVLEYLEGLDLGALVAQEGPMSIARVLDIGIQICEALADVHAAGILHRDLKPENIVLIKRGRGDDFVKILDFGICKVMSEQPLTATGVALGTPHFMSPEQLEARPEIDARTDVYAVGAILFHALTGRTPFTTESLPRLLVEIWSEPAPRVRTVRRDVPEALDALIARALEKRADRRFPDSRAFAAELTALAMTLQIDRSWASSSGVRELAPTPELSQRQVPQRSRLAVVMAAVMVAISVILSIGFIYSLMARGTAPTRNVVALPVLPAKTQPIERREFAPEAPPDATEEPLQPPAARPIPAPSRGTPVRRRSGGLVEPTAESPVEAVPAPQEPREAREAPSAPPPAAQPHEPVLVPPAAELRRVF